jgi:hypothetical protein
MCKKLAWVAVAVVVGLVAVNVTGLGSWVSVGAKRLASKIEKKVPPEAQIEVIKTKIDGLNRVINDNLDKLANESIQVEKLRKDSSDLRTRLGDEKVTLQALADQLDRGTTQKVSYEGHDVSPSQGKIVLTRKFNAYKIMEEQLRTKEKMLEARELGLIDAEAKVQDLIKQREELRTTVAQLEADLKHVELAETRSKVQIDDSELADIKQQIAKVKEVIQTRQKKVEYADQFLGNSNTTSTERKDTAGADPVRDVRSYFSGKDNKVVENK